jgi:DNA repair photolyase
MGEDGFRWRLAADDGGQGALFSDEELVDRHVGIGEYRGLEFLHVNAQRVINPVPKSSRMTFRYTINPYRGCSHACTYCLRGDTRILSADGGTKALEALRVGDRIIGTRRHGRRRRFEETVVLHHWASERHAYRVELDDGTELVTSAEHRFLSDRGWLHVADSPAGPLPCPVMKTGDALVGLPPRRARRVVSVSDLGTSMPMYDITTGTGDFVANGVVSHNCFARPTHEYLGLGIGEDFERKIVVKVNAVERVRAELRSRKWTGDLVAMGTNTDPYQRAEGKYHLTQGIVRALGEAANPFSILTKSTLILRDLDLLVAAAEKTEVHCAFSIGTLDERVWKMTEPGTPHPRRRVEAVRRLTEAGIVTGVLVAPILPGLSDRPEQLEEVTEACLDAGAESVTPIPLHLRPGVKEHFLSTMGRRDPEYADAMRRRYRGAYLPQKEQEEITAAVRAAKARHPAGARRPEHPFRRGTRRPAEEEAIVEPSAGGSGQGALPLPT